MSTSSSTCRTPRTPRRRRGRHRDPRCDPAHRDAAPSSGRGRAAASGGRPRRGRRRDGCSGSGRAPCGSPPTAACAASPSCSNAGRRDAGRRLDAGQREMTRYPFPPTDETWPPELAPLVVAVRAPAHPGELAGEDAAAGSFRAMRDAAPPHPMRRTLARVLAVKVAAGAAVLVAGGYAVAAATGAVPGPPFLPSFAPDPAVTTPAAVRPARTRRSTSGGRAWRLEPTRPAGRWSRTSVSATRTSTTPRATAHRPCGLSWRRPAGGPGHRLLRRGRRAFTDATDRQAEAVEDGEAHARQADPDQAGEELRPAAGPNPSHPARRRAGIRRRQRKAAYGDDLR